jgi:hypothetical protein
MSVPPLRRSKHVLSGFLVPDVLEKIMGFLSPSDRRTARLVNSVFRGAVSTHIRIISMPKPCKNPGNRVRRLLTEFPKLSDVRVRLQNPQDWGALIDPGVSPRLTHLTLSPRRKSEHQRMKYSVRPYPGLLPNLALFSNLRSLTIGDGVGLCTRGCDVLLSHLPSLERIQMVGGKSADVRALQRMPNLVDLDLVFSAKFDRDYRLDEDVGFPKLRSVRIAGACGGPSREFIALLGRLTGLTSLTWTSKSWYRLGPQLEALAHLSHLKSLCLKHVGRGSFRIPDLLSVSTLAGLTKLDLQLPRYDSPPPPWMVMPGPGLQLTLSGFPCLRELKLWAESRHVSQLTGLHVESLDRLELGPLWKKPDAAGLAVLRRATSLTRLCFHAHAYGVDEGLGRVIQSLTRLRSLDIKYDRSHSHSGPCLMVEQDLAPLKALTYLRFQGVLIVHTQMASMAASLGNPAWLVDSHKVSSTSSGSVKLGGLGSCGPVRANSSAGSQAPVRPHETDMLGEFSTHIAEGGCPVDSWAVSFGIEDKEEGYFIEKVRMWS